MEKFDLRTIKNKKPFRRVVNNETAAVLGREFYSDHDPQYTPGINKFVMMTQADFLEEYYPEGHLIFDTNYFPDIWREVADTVNDANGNPLFDENGEEIKKTSVYCERVPRYAFPFQQIIASEHIAHATGNDVQHELAVSNPSEQQEKLFDAMCSAWTGANMELAWYQAFKSREITADAAFVGSLDENGEFSWRVFSFLEGDHLYPHYDRYGKLAYFARVTNQYDEANNEVSETIEVWDDTNFYVFRRNKGDNRSIIEKAKDVFGFDNYTLIDHGTHGFAFIPVAYVRDNDGPGWSPSQSQIDCYELSFSQMAHNNQAYGEAILVLKSDSEIPVGITRDLSGSVKQIDLQGENDQASYLEGQSASESYMKQLDVCEDSIYRGSNAVKVPRELKAGDTPASAIKLLFANALNQAAADGMECEEFLGDMWRIFAYAYGYANNCILDAMRLPVLNWIKPFIHLSESAVTADLVALKGANILSAQTAQERASFYAKPGEARRIQREQKAQQDLELLYEREQLNAQTSAKERLAKTTQANNANANTNNGKASGSDTSTDE